MAAFITRELTKFQQVKGETQLVKHHIQLIDPTPIKQRYQPRNPKMQAVIDEEVDRMLKDGIIERSHSAWSSPVVIVRKKDGKPRFCVDFRRLNAVTKKDAYPLPYITSILDRLRKAKYFSTIDLKQGYWQVPLTPESRQLTAFTVPGRGLYQFRVMPFGLHAAPATFQRLLDTIIGPEMEPHAFAYLDDIVVLSATLSEHLEHLQEVFQRLRKANLQINPEKSKFAQNSIQYLGHVITADGIHTDPDKVAAIREIPAPTRVRELRRFLGAASWYRRFVADFAKIVAPLTLLLRKTQAWKWGEAQQTAFTRLKNALTSAPVLTCPDFSKPFELQTDASDYGLGAALVQRTKDRASVVAYASRALSNPERNYSVTEKECLAVVWAVQKMRPYLEGYHFTIITDHQSLRWLHSIQNPSGRLARWAIFLQQFDCTIQYRKGTLNQVADALSRQPLPHTPSEDCPELQVANNPPTWYDRKFTEVERQPRDHPDYRIRNGRLFHRLWDPADLTEPNADTEWKLCVPRPQQQQILEENHDRPDAGHLGIAKTLARIALRYHWPGMATDVTKYVRQCRTCQRFKPSQQAAPGLMRPPVVAGPWETVAVDIVGPLPRSHQGHAYLLVFQDRLTKWVECRPLRKATGATITAAFRELIVARYGCPRVVITDNGTEFNNNTFTQTLTALGIRHQLIPPYTPQANFVERVNRVLKPMLAQYCEADQRTWDRYLPEMMTAINTSRHESTGYTPAYLNYGHELTLPGEYHRATQEERGEQREPHVVPPDHLDRLERLEEARELARINLSHASSRQGEYYNRRRRDWQCEEGDRVMRREHPLSAAGRGYAAKLAPKYSGPWTVENRVSRLVYDLRNERGRRLHRIHIKDLKPAH